MGQPIFILGAGGMARETFDLYIETGREGDVLGFLEENCKNDGVLLNGKPVHDVSYLKGFAEKDKPLLIGAIGSTKRKRLIEGLEKAGYVFDTVIHASLIRSKWVKIEAGSIIAPGVILTCQVEIGRHVILNVGAHVSHDVQIGDFTTVSPGANIMGNSCLGEGVFVGANATIVERVVVGYGAIIAAGAVVIKDVPALTLVAGVPATVKKVYKSLETKPW
jgi:sugar O-acyltransferase (sialic acid O-acetyltransferase NeuD family)